MSNKLPTFDKYRYPEQAKGVQVLVGADAFAMHMLESLFREIVFEYDDYNEIRLPLLERKSLYLDRIGDQMWDQMYCLDDGLCLRPEATATIQSLSKTVFKGKKDIKLFYVTRCFRHEKPQSGRYREFTQMGLEWLNPSVDVFDEMVDFADGFVTEAIRHNPYVASFRCPLTNDEESECLTHWKTNNSAKRSLSYYTGNGFEISCDLLGAQRQVCGGGPYPGGFGFAFGLERLALACKAMVDQCGLD